jgi:hypothetical protein
MWKEGKHTRLHFMGTSNAGTKYSRAAFHYGRPFLANYNNLLTVREKQNGLVNWAVVNI